MNSGCVFLIGEGVDGHLVRYHECGIEAQTEMTDNLIVIGFIFVFLDEIRCTGKCNLVDIFFYFIGSHSKTVIDKC